MTVKVKKGSFTITGTPIELLILRGMMNPPHCLCQDNEACKARANVFHPVQEAMSYSTKLNCQEIEAELERLQSNQPKS